MDFSRFTFDVSRTDNFIITKESTNAALFFFQQFMS